MVDVLETVLVTIVFLVVKSRDGTPLLYVKLCVDEGAFDECGVEYEW